MVSKHTALIILDGRGISSDITKSAIAAAYTPCFDKLWNEYPHTTLEASGLAVGLPAGQMGNSEVGHMTIGAGRVLYQDLVKINKAIEENEFEKHPLLHNMIENIEKSGKKVHLFCLLSDAGVHAHIGHLYACIDLLEHRGVPYMIHGFMDGRDCDPISGIGYIEQLEAYIQDKKGVLVSIIGRYYAMDRNLRRDKTRLAYDLIVKGIGTSTQDFCTALQKSYEQGVTDEYLLGHIKKGYEQTRTLIDGDAVIFVNYRNDRPLQLVRALTQEDFPDYDMKKLDITMITMTEYDSNFIGVLPLYTKDQVNQSLGEMISNAGKSQLRIAETEKYPHVTFFFNGGRDEAFAGEERILIPSPDVYTYDLAPGMSSRGITDACIAYINEKSPDFICCNYAAPDMVGHTGNFQAVVETCEIVDICLHQLTAHLLEHNYNILIIADHGNADYMLNDDGSPNTAHSLAGVPCILVSKEYKNRNLKSGGSLANIAPTVVELMGLEGVEVMTGESLIEG